MKCIQTFCSFQLSFISHFSCSYLQGKDILSQGHGEKHILQSMKDKKDKKFSPRVSGNRN